jgi:hypothetical protein
VVDDVRLRVSLGVIYSCIQHRGAIVFHTNLKVTFEQMIALVLCAIWRGD